MIFTQIWKRYFLSDKKQTVIIFHVFIEHSHYTYRAMVEKVSEVF